MPTATHQAAAARRPAQTASTTKTAEAGTRPINTRWFKDVLAEKQITQRNVSASLSLDPASVSLMLRGKRRLQLDEAAALAQLLGVPLDDVLYHAGIDPTAGATRGSVPLMGWIDNEGEVHMRRPEGPRRAQAPAGMPENTVAVRFQTDDPSDGAVAYYVPKEGVDTDAVGRLCVVQLAPAGKGPRYLRVVKRGYQRGTWTLVRQDGSKPLENVELASASPVLWVRLAQV